MRWLVVCAIALAVPRPAHAVKLSICVTPEGFLPRPGEVLPRHPFLAYHGRRDLPHATATIDGARVRLTTRAAKGDTAMTLIEVHSERTGVLVIRFAEGPPTTYTITADRALPTELPGTIGRYPRLDGNEHRTVLDAGLAIWLPEGTPAVTAHVRLRRDAAGAWRDLELPVLASVDHPRPMIKIGAAGCEVNYPVGLLAKGVDLEVTVRLASGRSVRVTELAPHITLPDPLPRHHVHAP